MDERQKKPWFILSPKVYVNKKNNTTLLYNTETGEYMEITSSICRYLVDEVRKSENLGAVYFPTEYRENPDISGFITEATQKQLVKLIEVENGRPKPMVLLPVLNLQRDVDKLLENGHDYFIGRDILHYLHQLNININDRCGGTCRYCSSYNRQFFNCIRQDKHSELPPETISSVLSQAQNSLTKRVNLAGGDMTLYSAWLELWDILEKYDYDYHFYINITNIPEDKVWLKHALDHRIELWIGPEATRKEIINAIDSFAGNANINFSFIIENEEQYNTAESFTERLGEPRVNIIPFYSGDNLDFFEENIFIGKEDLFADTISMRNIFCNQKLNSNYFGNLTIMADGAVMANVNMSAIGNVYENSLLEIIYNELVSKSSWRNVRNGKVCSECLYQYLCPPPSNYEYAIERENLCKI